MQTTLVHLLVIKHLTPGGRFVAGNSWQISVKQQFWMHLQGIQLRDHCIKWDALGQSNFTCTNINYWNWAWWSFSL